MVVEQVVSATGQREDLLLVQGKVAQTAQVDPDANLIVILYPNHRKPLGGYFMIAGRVV